MFIGQTLTFIILVTLLDLIDRLFTMEINHRSNLCFPRLVFSNLDLLSSFLIFATSKNL